MITNKFQISNLKFEVTLVLILAITLASCNGSGKLPNPSSREYRDAVSAFYVGLGALQATDDIRAKQRLTQFTELAPGEPAGWVNLGVLALRQQEFDAAYENLEKARAIVPDNSRIEGMLGLVETKRGRFAEAIMHLREAVELDQKNLKAIYALAQEIERQGGESSEAEVQNLIEQILLVQPDNLAAQLELIRIAAKRGDAETARRIVGRIGQKAAGWPPEIYAQFTALQTAVDGPNVQAAATQVAFLRNVLVRLPAYRQSLAAIRNPTEETGEPFERFLKLASPRLEAAPPDEGLAFNAEPVDAGEGKWAMVGAIALDSDGPPLAFTVDQRHMRIGGQSLPFPAGGDVINSNAVAGIDYDYDFKTDLAMAGRGGFKLYRQESRDKFIDVTARMKLTRALTNAAFDGVWAADVDLDGDLDIVLGAVAGQPPVFRNNGDGTFKELRPFVGSEGLRGFVYADFDGDGDPDASLLDANGRLKFFSNERLGVFRERALPPDIESISAIDVGDINGDGVLDLLLLDFNFGVKRISDRGAGEGWERVDVIGRRTDGAAIPPSPGSVKLVTGDFDNNGLVDLAYGGFIWLNGSEGNNPRRIDTGNTTASSSADLTGDGRLDLLAMNAARRPVRLINRGTKDYHWQVIRPRAAQSTGDQRINSFGIGGEIEIRAGLLFQKQVIDSPLVHFGLGEQTQTDVARFIWPNGSIQGEFELKSDQAVLAEQRLKGSCPWLFAWNGRSMEFVKDCAPWSPALGLNINAQVTAGIQQTEEWMKIRGDQIAPRDGYYDLRVTAELWETYYIDHYSLVVVDHPAETEIYADERFSVPPPALKLYATSRPRPFSRALDDNGKDVTAVVGSLDEKYLDTFGRGRYQGLTRDHYVELALPDEAPRAGRLWLIAHGFVHPTDTTVNMAMSQPDGYVPPKGLSLEAPDGKGGWRVVDPTIGFPAGKNKTMLIDLTKVMTLDSPRRIRLRTNMEVYWDKLEWAEGLPEAQFKTQRFNAETAELRYRGYSVVSRADDSSPELPDYNRILFTGQKWRDMIGYFTRHGDVRELLEKVDDRMVFVNAGDEVRLRFQAMADPPAGWTRDYVMIGNGWIKDGDYNSTFSKTVLPLPDAKMREYTKPPSRLEDDPVYQRHARDWQQFHTRYVTPDRFRNAMKPLD
jgi:Tfp pilus assembly protein PilF